MMTVHPIREELPRVNPRSRSGRPSIPMGVLDDVHVLAVDDEGDAVSLVAAVIESAGARVTTAQSVNEAFARCRYS